jgi:serine/threonine-protein kinase
LALFVITASAAGLTVGDGHLSGRLIAAQPHDTAAAPAGGDARRTRAPTGTSAATKTPPATTPPTATPTSQPGKPPATLPPAAAGGRQTPRQQKNTSRRLPAPRARVEAKVYGPLECSEEYMWDVGHPAVARPCHATGPGVRLVGRLQALPGLRTDVSLTLRDTKSGAVVGGPFTCRGLLFSDFSRERTCGPFHVRPQRGRTYEVVQRWTYTGRTFLPAGEATSPPFTW